MTCPVVLYYSVTYSNLSTKKRNCLSWNKSDRITPMNTVKRTGCGWFPAQPLTSPPSLTFSITLINRNSKFEISIRPYESTWTKMILFIRSWWILKRDCTVTQLVIEHLCCVHKSQKTKRLARHYKEPTDWIWGPPDLGVACSFTSLG